MAVKLADTLAPMGEFPIANAKDIDFDDGESLQEKLDNGTLGGGGGASTADAIGYVNDTIGSTNVDDALNIVIAELHTHDNKEVLDLLSENEEGKLQYNGVIIGGEDGASTADAVEYINDTISSTNVEEALNVLVTDSHTHANKEVLDLLTATEEGKLQYNGTTIGGDGGASTADEVSYNNDTISVTNVEEALNKLISDYYYVKPSVTSFTSTPAGGIFEVGTTITAPITFNWNYNKDITTQSLTSCTLADETVRTATYDSDITSNKTFTLTASDGKNNASKNVSYSFTNKVWYGSASEGTYDDSFILGLSTGKLQTSKSGTYTVTVADREYFFIAMPQSYNNSDELVGKIGGFETTFGRVATVNHTNASGYATNYNIYKSTNASLGAISFII